MWQTVAHRFRALECLICLRVSSVPMMVWEFWQRYPAVIRILLTVISYCIKPSPNKHWSGTFLDLTVAVRKIWSGFDRARIRMAIHSNWIDWNAWENGDGCAEVHASAPDSGRSVQPNEPWDSDSGEFLGSWKSHQPHSNSVSIDTRTLLEALTIYACHCADLWNWRG
jgi:hypothetical protein